ncbi:type VI secretion system Vgr family protein [Qingshengfaniella alkalisoli]|uniref:Type VI secretion system tip protein VgrG n=1 Tax=Qingshengfaniella alkalisoli TaxID=2599296 RepID=A0A5B8IXN2_9RHOB|nr:type VI secretion system tip protein TssI/VgrG [Qingshengfaniella alkalisoli]QDY70922.1 type VI secretion system tip protein VgrG [Qingshengfaniella alkalisoli]
MAAKKVVFKNRSVRIEGSYKASDLVLKCAEIHEGLSQLGRATVEFLSNDRDLDLGDVLGSDIRVVLDLPKDQKRVFAGTCISVEFLGIYQGYGHFTAEVRPWLWMLTRTRDNRIFQQRTVPQIVADVLSDHGFSADVSNKLTGHYDVREYCVQYRESDFDFISRLMEEEGIYYYFTTEQNKLKMVLADSPGAHRPVEGDQNILFHFRERDYRRAADHIFEWSASERVTPGKVSLTDYNFEAPKTDLMSQRALPKGSHGHKSYEQYDYPGHFRNTGLGETFARIKMEAQAAAHQRWMGVGNARTIASGATFRLKEHPRVSDETDFLVTDVVHQIQMDADYDQLEDHVDDKILGYRLDFGDNKDAYRCVFGVVPKSVQYRAPLKTPWPEIAGLQTATVVGPSGEEIHTDEYGRIKVQFHWDRKGKRDDKSSCWVRTVMPWSGKGWGMVAVPRIGQEVVINFEEGDPDRPICTGMLYNAQTMPPYGLPGNMTQSGIKTNSSKGGGGFNELMFEDKKDAELVRFQSEKDYEQIIKNNAKITVGLEKKDKGDLEQTIHRHKTETLKTGDMTFKVEDGQEIREIAKDQSETIGGNRTQSIGKNSDVAIGSNSDIEVGSNMELKVGSNLTETIGTNAKLKAGTSITLEAGTKITLKVGASKIELTPAGITIKGPMVRIQAQTMAELKGSATVVVKGGVTLIN